MPKFELIVFPGDLIVNRIPETEIGFNLGYKLAAGRVVKSGIPNVSAGAYVIFGLQDAKEWPLPLDVDFGFELSQLGVFQLREGDLRAELTIPEPGDEGKPAVLPADGSVTILGE